MRFFGRAKSRLGVDIGASSIKVVELEKRGKQFELKTFGSYPIKRSIIRASGDTLEQEIAQKITELTAKVNVQTKSAVSSLPGFTVFTSVVDLPELSEKDRAFAIQTEAAKYVPAPLDEVILDSKEIENIDYGGGRTGKRILLIAAPRDYVDKFTRIFEQTTFQLDALEISSFALNRALVGESQTTAVIVDFGASSTDVSIVSSGALFLNRTIDKGGQDLTAIISRSLKIDNDRAEQFKQGVDLATLATGQEPIPNAMRPIIDSIIFDIQRVVDTFTSQYSRQIEKVIVTGGASGMRGLATYIQTIMKAPVEIGNPWMRVSYPSDYEKILQDIAPSFATAVGLAMREN